MQTRSFSEKTLRGSKSEQKQKHPPFLEDLRVFRGVQGYETLEGVEDCYLPCCKAASIWARHGGPHQTQVLWLDYPTCKLPPHDHRAYLNFSPLSFLSLRHTARSTWPILSSRTFVSTACAILDPLSCHVSYGFLTGLAFVVYWGIILFGYDTYVEWLHSDWMISFWSHLQWYRVRILSRQWSLRRSLGLFHIVAVLSGTLTSSQSSVFSGIQRKRMQSHPM